jgi:hypothetical protein
VVAINQIFPQAFFKRGAKIKKYLAWRCLNYFLVNFDFGLIPRKDREVGTREDSKVKGMCFIFLFAFLA